MELHSALFQGQKLEKESEFLSCKILRGTMELALLRKVASDKNLKRLQEETCASQKTKEMIARLNSPVVIGLIILLKKVKR